MFVFNKMLGFWSLSHILQRPHNNDSFQIQFEFKIRLRPFLQGNSSLFLTFIKQYVRNEAIQLTLLFKTFFWESQ